MLFGLNEQHRLHGFAFFVPAILSESIKRPT
jgi:hypothetical protein